MDDKMSLYREWCFPNFTNSLWKKIPSQVLEGSIAPIAPLWIRPCARSLLFASLMRDSYAENGAISFQTHICRINAYYTNSLHFCFGALMQITSINTLRVALKLLYDARRYHSPSLCNTGKGKRMAEMEAICFLLQIETHVRQLARLCQ